MLIKENGKMRLTTTKIDSFEVEDKTCIVWDDRLPSFGVRVSRTGLKSYFLQYRVGKNGRQRGKTIGRHPVITADRAREVARDWLLQAWDNVDSNAKIKCADETNPTVEEFGARYLEEHSRVHKKKTSIVMDEDFMKRFVVPKIGNLRITDITRFDIARVHSSLSKTPHQANLVRALLSHLFTMAEAWGLRPDGTNPCKHIKKFPTKARVRFLADDELTRLALELKVCDKRNPVAANYFRLVLLTGCRRNEILHLKWSDISFEEKYISLRDSKTGPRKVPLADAAISLLQTIERMDGNPHIFPGKIEGQHLTTVKTTWKTIRRNAQITDIHIHDLRHTFATIAGSQGVPEQQVQGLLGHASPQTTRGYMHKIPADQLAAANKTAATLANILFNQ